MDAVLGAWSSAVSASVTSGISFSQSDYSASSSNANPSSLVAGRDIIGLAGRDITIEGGQVVARDSVILDAGQDVTIVAAQSSGDFDFPCSSSFYKKLSGSEEWLFFAQRRMPQWIQSGGQNASTCILLMRIP